MESQNTRSRASTAPDAQARWPGRHRNAKVLPGLGLVAVLMAMFAATFASIGLMKPNSASAHVIDTECTLVGVGIAIRGEFAGTTEEAAFAEVGDTIEYAVTVDLDASECPITGGEVILELPDGSSQVIASDLTLMPGETQEYVDVASYTVVAADVGPDGFLRATASVSATSHRATGIDQQVAASTNFDTLLVSPLELNKTASPAFDREFSWEIAKEVNPDSWNLFDGDTGTSEYTVTATKGEPVDSNYAVSGVISIHNPNNIDVEVQAVTDEISDGIAATVDCGADFPLMVAAGATIECTYGADLPDASARVNTATVEASFDLGGTATADIDFSGVEPTEVVNDSITVSDTNAEFGGEQVTSETMSWQYDVVFGCEGLEFVDGQASFTHDNTATILETEQSATATVNVDCYQLNVTKDVSGTQEVAYDWSVLKTAEPETQTVSAGMSADVMWTVTVDLVESISGEIMISGQITISNPNPGRDALVNEVSDEIGGLVADVDCGGTAPYTVPAGGTLVCDYEVTGEPTALENTATAVQQNYAIDSEGGMVEAGTSSYSGTATLAEGDVEVTATDFCATVTDEELGLNEVVCADAALPAVFSGIITYGAETLVCGENTVTNIATLIEQDSSDTSESTASAIIIVECPDFAGCTPGFWKNHTGVWQDFGPSDTLASAGFVFPASLSGFSDDTLLEALNYGGGPGADGGARILLRAAVASLLNADHDDVNFVMTEAEVIADVNAALATEDRAAMLQLASELDSLNNTGCSIDAHGRSNIDQGSSNSNQGPPDHARGRPNR